MTRLSTTLKWKMLSFILALPVERLKKELENIETLAERPPAMGLGIIGAEDILSKLVTRRPVLLRWRGKELNMLD